MKHKFEGVKAVFNLISYGLSVDFYESEGIGYAKKPSYFFCRDYGSDDTGEIVYSLLVKIANKDWDGCIETLKKIKKEERG
jgi:hypothetical protein